MTTPYELIDRYGFYLFPVKGKTPLVKWKGESTNVKEKIKAWENLPGRTGWGIDCEKSGIAVIDVDSGKVAGALERLQGLEFEHGELPQTLTIRTTSGGLHMVYKGAIKNSASSKLGIGLDTRGSGGFVVAAGSPGYDIIGDHPIAGIPGWVVGLAGNAVDRQVHALPPTRVDLDSDTAIALATRFLHSVEPAIEGLGGDMQTFKTACGVRDYGVSKSVALSLMLEHWNDTCSPPWTPEDLERKIANAYSYASEPIGAANPEVVFPSFDAGAASPESATAMKPLFIDAADLINRKLKVNYLIRGLVETPTTGLIFGASESGKSMVAIDMCMSVVHGMPWFGKASTKGRVLYFNGEGHTGFQRRIMGWLQHKGMPNVMERGSLSITQRRIDISDKSVMALEPHIKADIDKYGPLSMIVVDTVARHMVGDENKVEDMSKFLNALDYLKDRFNCVVYAVHHTGKGSQEYSRGSSAIKGALDWEIRVAPGEVKWYKMKESEKPMPRGFEIKRMVLEEATKDEEAITAGVVVEAEYDPTGGKDSDLPIDAGTLMQTLKFEMDATGIRVVKDERLRELFYLNLGEIKPESKRQKYHRAKTRILSAGIVTVTDKGVCLKDEAIDNVEDKIRA